MKTENLKYPIIGSQFYNPHRKEVGKILYFDHVYYAKVQYFESGDQVGHNTADIMKFMNSNKNNKDLQRIQQEREREQVTDLVLERIKDDVESGDFTAIDELLKFCPIENLKGYLAED